MQEPAVLKWDKVIHKGARTSDGEPLGYIAAEDADWIFVLAGRFKDYRIPKIHVKAFDGAEVRLDAPLAEMNQYRVQ